MWVAELTCPHGHGFEGWFGSRADFDDQARRGLVQCPACGSAQIERRLSAPRLNLGASETPPRTVQDPAAAPAEQSQARRVRELVAAVLANSEDLGRNFAQEARRIHQGEAPERAIRGQANAAEFSALQDEGIEVWALPLPVLADDERSH